MIVRADQNRIDEPELGDGAGDLRDLLFRMRPRVARIGDQSIHGNVFDIQFHLDDLTKFGFG